MSIAKFTVGRRGASGRHASYITRESACRSISFYNLDEQRGENDFENRVNAISHAYAREDIETAKSERGRTHYRIILSWDRKEETDIAKEQAHEFLKENFDKGRGFVAVHQDTEHTHAHVWLDARTNDGRKLHIGRSVYRQLDESWAKQYDRNYQTEYAKEYKEKKEQTRQWKRDRVQVQQRGQSEPAIGKQERPPDKPERYQDNLKNDFWREKDQIDKGVTRSNDENGIRGNQQSFTVRSGRSETGKRELNNSQQQLTNSERAVSRATKQTDRTESEARGLHQAVARVAQTERGSRVERSSGRDQDDERGR
ncbi:hypothetical protein BH10ACI1_BH10ACI1_05010 [soil metagenome]